MNMVVLDQSVLPIEVLYSHLAAAVGLHVQMKHTHLIERGADSIALQKLFDRVLTDIEAYSDQLAELAVAFDHFSADEVQPEPTRGIAVRPLDEAGFGQDQRHLFDVTAALLDFGESVQTAIDENIRRGDDVKAHLFTEVLRDIGEQLSVVESYIAPKKTGSDPGGTTVTAGHVKYPVTSARQPDLYRMFPISNGPTSDSLRRVRASRRPSPGPVRVAPATRTGPWLSLLPHDRNT